MEIDYIMRFWGICEYQGFSGFEVVDGDDCGSDDSVKEGG